MRTKTTMRKTISLLLTAAFAIAVSLLVPGDARADNTITYLYYVNEENAIAGTATQGQVNDYTVVNSSTTAWGNADSTSECWYVVNTGVTISDRIIVTGTVHLILCDGVTLTAEKGIGVPEGCTLNIYAQSNEEQRGILIANRGEYGAPLDAGIGGNYLGTGGTVTINGGTVNAFGDSGAGIGCSDNGTGGIVTINGGEVTASSRYHAAGIGGGTSAAGGTVTINGGKVTANGSEDCGAGIGGGLMGDGGIVTINGGEVTAIGGLDAAGIGGGANGDGGVVMINGGIVRATGTGGGAGIGGGTDAEGGNVTINGGYVSAKGGSSDSGIGMGIGAGRRGNTHGSLKLGPNTVLAGNRSIEAVTTERAASAEETITYDSVPYRYMKAWDTTKWNLESVTVTFQVSNGKWNDGTSDEKTVTLIRKSGEDLLLSLEAEDIPAAGEKPAVGYMAGGWEWEEPGWTNDLPWERTFTNETTYTYTYAAHPHSYTSRVIRKANCTHTGTVEYTCSCGDSYASTIPKQSHDLLLKSISMLPTATAEGKALYVCKRCGNSVERTVPVLTDEAAGNVVTPVTKTVPVTGILDGKSVNVSISSTYDSEVTYSGKKFSPKKDLLATVDLSGLTDRIVTNGKYSAKSLFKITYVSGNNKKAGAPGDEKAPYYYLKIKLNEEKAKKAGLKKNTIKELKALVKALNLSLKEQKCFYTIRPIRLDQELTVVKIKGKIKKGKIKEISSIKVSAYVNGKRKTFTLSKKKYPVELLDTDSKIIRITGSGNFEGTKEVFLQ